MLIDSSFNSQTRSWTYLIVIYMSKSFHLLIYYDMRLHMERKKDIRILLVTILKIHLWRWSCIMTTSSYRHVFSISVCMPYERGRVNTVLFREHILMSCIVIWPDTKISHIRDILRLRLHIQRWPFEMRWIQKSSFRSFCFVALKLSFDSVSFVCVFWVLSQKDVKSIFASFLNFDVNEEMTTLQTTLINRSRFRVYCVWMAFFLFSLISLNMFYVFNLFEL